MVAIFNKVANFFNDEVDSDVLVQEIHDAFDSSLQKEDEEIKKQLKELNIPGKSATIEKAERLTSLGFKSSEIVVKALEERKKITEAHKIKKNLENKAQKIWELKARYPFSNFISFESLKEICKKYNLIYAPVTHYLKDVPEKNLLEIEKRQLLQNSDVNSKLEHYVKVVGFREGISREIQRKFSDFVKVPDKYTNEIYSLQYGHTNSFKKVFDIDSKHFRGGVSYMGEKIEVRTVEKTGLFICAPKTHFDLKNLQQQDDFGYAHSTTKVIKDPVVFEFLNNGICRIVSKWGKEAEDVLLVNPVEN